MTVLIGDSDWLQLLVTVLIGDSDWLLLLVTVLIIGDSVNW